MKLLPFNLCFSVSGMAMEGSCRGEFAQLMSDHFLRHKDRNKFFPIMDRKGQPNHFRYNGGSPRPCFDHFASFVLRASSTFFIKWVSTKGPFLIERAINLSSSQYIDRSFYFFGSSFPELPTDVQGCLPPELFPSPPPRGWSMGFIATPRTTGLQPEPAISSRLSQGDIFMFEIAHLADGGIAILKDQPDFAGGEFDMGIFSFFRHQLAIGSCAPNNLPPLSHLQFDIMNQGSSRNISEG